MGTVTLSEQMGAMALIDELRHSKHEVQKHLDLPARRIAVAERIRSYYKDQNLEVEDSFVEQGVRQYFASRLTFETPQIGPVSKLLSGVYISRSRWIKPFAGIAFATVVAGLGAFQVSQYFAHARTAAAQSQSDEARGQEQTLKSQLAQLLKRITTLNDELVQENLSTGRTILGVASDRLADAAEHLNTPIPATVTDQSRSADLHLISEAVSQLQSAAMLIKSADQSVSDVVQLMSADMKLKALESSAAFPTLSKQYRPVAAFVAHAHRTIEEADTKGIGPVLNAVAAAQAVVQKASGASEMTSQLLAAKNAVNALKLNAGDARQFEALYTVVEGRLNDLDNQGAAQGLESINNLRAYAATAVNLDVISRAGQKSMVERTYDASRGKTWYLLTEATDAAGNAVAVPVTSAETGVKAFAKVFGVRVSHAAYQAAYKDKLEDGRVDDHVIGHKDANSLTLNFTGGRVTANPEFILEW
ncbi:DUF6384 family protein [Pseudomonas sp. LS-2]|uniref:DUF6384 family protein n=1 Tax=Pseudomonas sp. LS-2 TaxID=2315859 RepID=UPI0015B1756F|nr:DUF6384 family protein [Pseudomonas sp. LS-2]